MIASRGRLSESARETAQVAVPDHRFDRLPVTALDLAGEDAPACRAADIGVEKIHGGVAQRVDLDDAREGELQEKQAIEISARESTGLVGDDAHQA
jgi:hypothetical protein